MPTYEYECRSCGASFDVFQSMSDDPLKVCPTCGNSVRRKINGGTGIIFKGSGFYKNDSRKASSSSTSSSGSKSDSVPKNDSASSPPAASSGAPSGDRPKAEAPKAETHEKGAPKKDAN
jgi:putative FmdB family regulatory protein